MKKQLVLILAIGVMFLFVQSFSPELPQDTVIPDEITSILKNSCYDCHFTGSSAEKALNAMNFDTWNEYRTTKKIGLLADISEVLEEQKMPPGKYLERKPEAKLSEKHVKLLTEWADAEAEKLMQGN